MYFVFDLLFLDGEKVGGLPLLERKERLNAILGGAPRSVQYSDHHIGDGQRFLQAACGAKAEGIISKRVDALYVPGDRGLWRKAKCYQREEFVIVGYSEPEGSRPYIGPLLLAYYDDAGGLVYAGRVGTGMSGAELRRVYEALQPLRTLKMPLNVPPPRMSRFGSPLDLSRVTWVRPKLVCEVRFLTWTADGLLRQGAYEGLRADKPARDVRRPRLAKSNAIIELSMQLRVVIIERATNRARIAPQGTPPPNSGAKVFSTRACRRDAKNVHSHCIQVPQLIRRWFQHRSEQGL